MFHWSHAKASKEEIKALGAVLCSRSRNKMSVQFNLRHCTIHNAAAMFPVFETAKHLRMREDSFTPKTCFGSIRCIRGTG